MPTPCSRSSRPWCGSSWRGRPRTLSGRRESTASGSRCRTTWGSRRSEPRRARSATCTSVDHRARRLQARLNRADVECVMKSLGPSRARKQWLRRRELAPVFGALAMLVLAYFVFRAVRPTGSDTPLVDGWGVDGFELVVAGLCVAGGMRRGRLAAAPLVLGAALAAWALGD